MAINFIAIIAFINDCQGFAPAILPRTAIRFPLSVTSSRANVPRSSSWLFPGPNVDSFGWRNRRNHQKSSNHWTTQLAAMSDEAAFLSDDPFIILGLDAPTADKKILKRAYKKRALKFHPDVVTDIHSTPEEKKKASDRFAKINGAYEQLMGKGKGNGSSSSTGSTSSSSSDGWTPPHRRNSGYKSSSSSSSSYSEGASTDWRDYMPDYRKDSDADYDTGGDSFGQIFSDLFTGAASAAVTGGIGGLGGGIFNEFLEFLEGGSGSGGGFGSEDDADLRVLLQTGSLEEIAEEMDDTELVVKQLEKKSRGLDDEVFAMDAEAKMASRFSEKIELEEKAAEIKARQDVVNGYLDRARKRLLKLQTRYKDLIAYGGANDDYATKRQSRSSWSDVRDEASSSYSSSGSSSYGSTSTRTTEPSSSSTEPTNNDSSSESDTDSWMNEGFGSSSGRSRGRRGSGRRRARSRASAGVDSNPPRPSPNPSPSPSTSYSTSNSSNNDARRSPRPSPQTSPSPSSSSAVSKSNYSYDVPPHRRATGSSSFASRQEEDRKRMQEIKVDEEFEKLKKDLGL